MRNTNYNNPSDGFQRAICSGCFGGMRWYRCRAFSLVELMVAMAVSLLLLGGVLQLFVQSNVSYKLQDGLARAQESGRLGILFIERHLLRAGYPQDAIVDTNNLPIVNPAFSRSVVGSSPAFTGGITGPEDGGAGSDALLIQFQSPDGGMADCTGRNVGAGTYVTMHFFLDGSDLKCESAIASDGSALSATLIDGIDDMQITYSLANEDDIPDGSYVIAGNSTLDADDEWEQVIVVHIELTTSEVEPVSVSGNRQLTFSTTVPIRNMIGR